MKIPPLFTTLNEITPSLFTLNLFTFPFPTLDGNHSPY